VGIALRDRRRCNICCGGETFGRTQAFVLGDPPGERLRLFISQGLRNAFYCHNDVDYFNEISEATLGAGRNHLE
jgi:hypothetical protein